MTTRDKLQCGVLLGALAVLAVLALIAGILR
jgi:hypothetical protein